jgi:hypothetical protein
MQSTSQSAPIPAESSAMGPEQLHKRDNLAYQAVTVAAILLLLGSLWVF